MYLKFQGGKLFKKEPPHFKAYHSKTSETEQKENLKSRQRKKSYYTNRKKTMSTNFSSEKCKQHLQFYTKHKCLSKMKATGNSLGV